MRVPVSAIAPSTNMENFVLWLEDAEFRYFTFKGKNRIHRIGQFNAGQRLYTACGVQIMGYDHCDTWWNNDATVNGIESSTFFCKRCAGNSKRLVLSEQVSI